MKLSVYIVEDSYLIRENLIATLEETIQLNVIGTAEDEATAIKWMGHADHICDLIIIDLFLKSGSGLGVLRMARDSGKPWKLVVFSNYASPTMRTKCLALGADGVFNKPDEIDLLINYCADLTQTLSESP